MTRPSESRAQRTSRRGTNNNDPSGSSNSNRSNTHEDERDQTTRREERGRSRHRRRSSGRNNYESATAVGRESSNKRGAEEIAANDVLGDFYNMLLQGAPPQQEGDSNDGTGKRGNSSIHIDLRKASNVLEAAAGNLALAANLYWDDYFATQAANQFAAEADAPSEPKARDINLNDDAVLDKKPAAEASARDGVNRSFRFEQNNNYDDERNENYRRNSSRSSHSSKKRAIHLAADYSSPSKRRLRRSLDSDFEAADDDNETKMKKRAAKRARKSNDFTDNSMSINKDINKDDETNEDDQKMPAIRRGNDEELDNGARPPPRQRVNRNHVIRQQDIVQGDDNVGNDRKANENGFSSDEQEDNDNSTRRMHHNRARRHRKGEPRRISGVEASISVSDDENGKVSNTKNRSRSHRKIDRNSLKEASSKYNDCAVSRSAVMKAVKAIHQKINPKTTHLSKPSTWILSPEQGRRRQGRDNDDDCSADSDTEDYISDDDWLGGETTSTPMECLWGTYREQEQSTVAQPALRNNSRNNEDSSGNVVADDDVMNISGEDEDAYDSSGPPFRSKSGKVEEPSFTGIPYAWLNAGFQLSECGTGLVIKSPRVEDIEFFSWRQQQVNDKRNAVPPPFHCKALTAITSIVTGLLYNGASIQGIEVNFTSGKKAWSSLTTDERKREFESRLSDALSSLIFVAAHASLKRKKKAYRKAIRMYKPTNIESNYSDLLREAIAEKNAAFVATKEDHDGHNSDIDYDGKENDLNYDSRTTANAPAMVEDTVSKYLDRKPKEKMTSVSREKKELMRRRLDLIPTCIWADKKAAVAPRAGDAPLYNSNVKVKISWTNIRDIQLYVNSNLRAFTEKGGIALFLETLVRIHGNDVIARQINRCSSGMTAVPGKLAEKGEITCKTKSSSCFRSLIRYTCEERQKRIHEDNPLPLNVRTDPNKLLDTTPSGTECTSVELLSLLLTGRVCSSWKDCSSNTLGIGLLTENIGEVSQALARPKQPVWLLKGEECYSLLTVEGRWSGDCNRIRSSSDISGGLLPRDDLKMISKVDEPGASLDVRHWNGWYGQRNETRMRLVVSRLEKEVPSKKLLANFSDQYGSTNMKRSPLRRRRYENLINTISAEEHKFNEIKENKMRIHSFDLERVKIHPEDQKLYPKNHKMWRFDLVDNNNSFVPTMDQKPASQTWVPYFQLTSRQKRIVETKLGPKIKTILWTRWPEAIIDNFAPCEGGFPVV